MFKFDPSTNSIDNYVSKITNVDSAFKTKIKIEMYKLVHTNNEIYTLSLLRSHQLLGGNLVRLP